MNPLVFKAILTVAIEVLKYLRRRRNLLTPEQRAALDKATKESFDNAGNMGSGAIP